MYNNTQFFHIAQEIQHGTFLPTADNSIQISGTLFQFHKQFHKNSLDNRTTYISQHLSTSTTSTEAWSPTIAVHGPNSGNSFIHHTSLKKTNVNFSKETAEGKSVVKIKAHGPL